ncbi:MAG TPA: hypothetical protein VHA52_07730 [Candidatus Babeliaceae bacterium]|nr:hypothetical protein [Candidatus Babeliaceae bacterium]
MRCGGLKYFKLAFATIVAGLFLHAATVALIILICEQGDAGEMAHAEVQVHRSATGSGDI